MRQTTTLFRTPKPQHARGFGLAELLVSMLLFAFGVVTMVALQGRLQKTAFDNKQRQSAVFAAQELAARLSLQPEVLNRAVGGYQSQSCNLYSSIQKNCAGEPNKQAKVCTGEEMVTYDLAQVLCNNDNSLNNTLVDWQLQIQCASRRCPAGEPVTISISWLSTNADSIDNLRGQSSAGSNRSAEYDQLSWEFVP